MLAPSPVSPSPQNDLVTVAHIAPSPSVRRIIASLLFGIVAVGCRDDASAAGAKPRDDTANAAVVESAGDVVIMPKGAYTVTAVASPGVVRGTVALSGAVALQAPIATGADSALCGASVPDESVQQQGSGIGSVVVWLDDIRAGKAAAAERRLELESNKCRLEPRVQAAVVGSAVNVIGHDVFRQHLRWMSAGEKEPRAVILLGRNEQVIPTELPARTPGLVVIRDMDHEWPRAFLAVFAHPYFAVTKPDGSFTIDGVPPGAYTLRAWHERTKVAEQKVTVTAGGTATANLTLQSR